MGVATQIWHSVNRCTCIWIIEVRVSGVLLFFESGEEYSNSILMYYVNVMLNTYPTGERLVDDQSFLTPETDWCVKVVVGSCLWLSLKTLEYQANIHRIHLTQGRVP